MIKSDKGKDVKMESIFKQVVIDGQVPATCGAEQEVEEEEEQETPLKKQKIEIEAEEVAEKQKEEEAEKAHVGVPVHDEENLSDKNMETISDSDIVSPAEVEKKNLILAESLNSSCNNSQAVEIRNKLGIPAKNDEFSFNDCGNGPNELSDKQIKSITNNRGQTLRISP